jgi:ABC-2 type transport system permease protein
MTNSETQRFIELLFEMTKKELKTRYKNTFLGFLWIIINPLMQMLVIGFIFRFFISEQIPNYYLYLLTGLLIWNFFSLSLSKATPSIVNERSLIKKAKFSREVIPLSIVLSNFIHLLISCFLLLVPAMYIGLLTITNFPRILIGGTLLLLFTTGLSLLTSALNVRFRDVTFIVQAVLIVWFYATPIVYSINVIPDSLIWIWRLNPLTSIVQIFQNAIISAPAPGPAMLLFNMLVILIVFIIGLRIFSKESKNFDDWV